MTFEIIRQILIIAATIAAVVVLSSQCRKPRWWLGRLNVRLMNARHSAVTDWGLKEVPVEGRFTILDVGCGGGRTVDKLAAIASDGKVYGIDYSAASAVSARRTNSRWIDSGRVEINQSSVSHLPFPDYTFDLVTAVETHYYWPDPVSDLREIRRVLKPGGRLVIIAETFRGQQLDILYRPVMKLLRANYLTVEEHRGLFSAAGYSEIAVREEHDKGWICVVGRRPLLSA
jgi:ubiquinone/menaquinone biosynthesis C-methylase UbiE